MPLYGIHKLGMSLYGYVRESLCQPFVASVVSIVVMCGLSIILPKESIHWLIRVAVFSAVVGGSFIAISLRKETADLVALVKRKFGTRKGH